MKKINLTFSIFLILTMLMMTSVYAFGIASSNGPFTVYPGETKTAKLWLQNMMGDDDITVRAEIINGSGIAEIIGNPEYLVKLGTDDTEVPIRIKIPSDVTENATYKVTVSFLTITPGQATGIAFGTGIEKTINVLVVAPEEKAISNTTLIIIAIVIILIIIIAVILLRRKKGR